MELKIITRNNLIKINKNRVGSLRFSSSKQTISVNLYRISEMLLLALLLKGKSRILLKVSKHSEEQSITQALHFLKDRLLLS